MLNKIFSRKQTKKTSQNNAKKYAIAQTGSQLLDKPERIAIIRKIKRLFSVTDEVWNDHYLYAIQQFAELVQELPASEFHHHSNLGGLIDHTLDAVHVGARVSQGYVLPPNCDPEKLASSSDRWRFGAFIAIIAHDIGKIVTDIEVVYRIDDNDFQRWHPWTCKLPAGAEYIYRYKPKIENAAIAKTLHEKAAMSLLPNLLTQKATFWIFEDTELLAQMFSTITHSTFGGHAISEIVRQADRTSVAQDLGADTGKNLDTSSAIPLHEKLITSLRKLISDGELKLNRPGAGAWVSETDTWCVSKATMEAVRIQLINEGHKGIPKNIVRLFEVIREHDLLIPNQDGDSVWYAEINDFNKKWTQKLTFLRFKNSVLWPTVNPVVFNGEITPLDRNGKIITVEDSLSDEEILTNENTKSSDVISALPDKEDNQISNNQVAVVQSDTPKPSLDVDHKKPLKSSKPSKPASQDNNKVDRHETIKSPLVDVKESSSASRKVSEDVLKQNQFLSWLLEGVSKRVIRVNEPKAQVHILDHYIALVSPSIFELYLKKNPLKRSRYEKEAKGRYAYTSVQRELESLDIHQKGTNGQNIVTMLVTGSRSQSELKVYLLNRDCFPSLSNFSANKAMKVEF